MYKQYFKIPVERDLGLIKRQVNKHIYAVPIKELKYIYPMFSLSALTNANG